MRKLCFSDDLTQKTFIIRKHDSIPAAIGIRFHGLSNKARSDLRADTLLSPAPHVLLQQTSGKTRRTRPGQMGCVISTASHPDTSPSPCRSATWTSWLPAQHLSGRGCRPCRRGQLQHAIARRVSCRAYQPIPVPQAQLMQILEACPARPVSLQPATVAVCGAARP
jgi:hypothetical protein